MKLIKELNVLIKKVFRHARRTKTIKLIIFYFFVIVLCSVFFSPFLVMLTTSFKTMEDAFTIPVRVFPRKIVFSNYPAAFNRIPYFKYMGNTLFLTVLSLLGE